MPNDPGTPSPAPSKGFASIVTLVSDVSRELLMVKGQLPGPMELPQPKASPTPQAAPRTASQPAYQPASPKPQRAPQRVSQLASGAARQKVNAPAVMLMVTAGLGLVVALMGLVSSGGGSAARPAPGGSGVIFLNLFQLAASGFIFFGALKMKNLESHGLAMAASIVAIIPCFTSCFFAIPAGIWSLVVLCKADVKAAFR